MRLRELRVLLGFALLLPGCVHRAVPALPTLEVRAQKWNEWAKRVEALPACLPQEWTDAPPLEGTTFEPGQTVHVRGQLTLIEFDCREQISDLLLRGRWLPTATSELTLSEIEAEVGRSERETCGSVLGLRAGEMELAIEEPFNPLRVWRENDALLFGELLSQTGAVVFGVVDASRGPQVLVRVDRACRMAAPALTLPRVRDDGRRWKLLDGLEQLADDASLPRVRRAQALQVLFDVSFSSDRLRAQRAADRLAAEFGDRSRLERLLKARSLER